MFKMRELGVGLLYSLYTQARHLRSVFSQCSKRGHDSPQQVRKEHSEVRVYNVFVVSTAFIVADVHILIQCVV